MAKEKGKKKKKKKKNLVTHDAPNVLRLLISRRSEIDKGGKKRERMAA